MTNTILNILLSFSGVILIVIVTILIEKAKIKTPKIKYLRVLRLDCEVPETILKTIEKKLKKNSLFKNINIFIDNISSDTPCLYHYFYEEKKDLIIRKRREEVEGYEGKEKELDCWKYPEIMKEIVDMTKNEEFGVIAITTLPISSKYYTGVNGGSYDKIEILEKSIVNRIINRIKKSNVGMAILPYEKKIIRKNPDSVISVAEHEIAHLIGLDNYNFICGEFQSPPQANE